MSWHIDQLGSLASNTMPGCAVFERSEVSEANILGQLEGLKMVEG